MAASEIDGMHGAMAAGMCEAAFLGRGSVSRAALEMGLAVYRVDLDRLAKLRPTVILTQARPTAASRGLTRTQTHFFSTCLPHRRRQKRHS